MNDVLLVPLAFLVGGALLILGLPRRAAPLVALVALFSASVAGAIAIGRLAAGAPPMGLGGALRLDERGAIMLALALLLGLLAGLLASETEEHKRRFYFLLLSFTATMALAAMADNLGVLWASVEATTLASALLVGHRKTKEATEAAWKYLILSSTGILLAFLATILIMFASSLSGTPTLSWRALLAQGPALDPEILGLVLVLATVGYGTKAGLVPLHFWLPDAHSEAPSPVSGLLSGVLLACSLLALDRIAIVAAAAGAPAGPLLLPFGAVSVLVGGALVLGARNYKRMLAYHSIENMGLVAFAFGIGTPLAVAGAYFHVVTHGVSKGLAFFSAGRIHHHFGSKEVAGVRGALARTPVAAWGLLVGVLGLIGVPGFGPFTSKVMILAAAVAGAPWPFTLMVVAGIALAFVGGMHHLSAMMPGAAGTDGPRPPPVREPGTVVVSLGLLAILSLMLGLAGPYLLRSLLAGMAAGPGVAP